MKSGTQYFLMTAIPYLLTGVVLCVSFAIGEISLRQLLTGLGLWGSVWVIGMILGFVDWRTRRWRHRRWRNRNGRTR